MKRKITFLIAVLMLLTMITQPNIAVGQTRIADSYTATSGDKPTAVNGTTSGSVTGTNSISWSYSVTQQTKSGKSPYVAYSDASGWQLGSGNSPCKAFSISTSGISGTITQIQTVTGSKSASSNIYVTVGGEAFGTQGQATGSGSSVSTQTFSGSASGTIVVSASASSEAFYFKSVTVTYSAYAGPTKTITFNGNGGTYSEAITYTQTVPESTTTALTANKFTYEGHAFLGWSTDSDGDVEYADEASINTDVDVTLYAKWRELATYTLVTSVGDIEPGKHYIIASSMENGTRKGMGSQGDNNRAAVDVTVSTVGGKQTITEATGLYEFVISGPQTISETDYYTIYDESVSSTGYLYAPLVSDKNYLRTRNSIGVDDKAIWTITIDGSSKVATVKTKATGRNWMQFNSTIFSCYSSAQSDIYIYKKNSDPGTTYYSPTTVNSALNITTPTTIGNGGVLDMGSNALSISGDGSLTIEDGGQLITSSAVSATIEKNITAASKDIADHWYTIASSVNAPTFVSVTNLTDDEEYDLYRYDESSFTWQNSKKDMGGGVQQFTAFENGRGYLYRKAGSETIKYVGTINTGDLENYSLSWASTNNDLKGLNLIGNPFPHNIYKGYGGAIDDAKLSDKFYYLENNGTWQVGTYTTAIKPGMGIIVQTNSAGDITIKDNATPATAEHDPAKANNDEIMLTVSNSQHQDVAYAVFGDRYGLKKIEHRSADAPMLYIPQNNRRYAVAMMSDDTKSFNLNFKAMTIGSYTLSYKSKGDFDYVHVIDCLTGEDIDMLQGEYSFIATPGDNENRFIVRLGYMPNNEGTENEIFAYQNGNNILVSGEGELQVFDVTGRMVVTQHVNGVETINVQSQGVYIFKLNEKVQKIVVR